MSLQIWNISSSECKKTLSDDLVGLPSVLTYTGDTGQCLVTGYWDGTTQVSPFFCTTTTLNVCVYVIVLHKFNFFPQIWDLETETCVQTLEGHTDRISSVYRHPELPVLLTGSHDGTVRTWNSDTYRYRALLVCYMISVRYNKGFEKSFPILFKPRENN
jgi:coatomer subunit beta'